MTNRGDQDQRGHFPAHLTTWGQKRATLVALEKKNGQCPDCSLVLSASGMGIRAGPKTHALGHTCHTLVEMWPATGEPTRRTVFPPYFFHKILHV